MRPTRKGAPPAGDLALVAIALVVIALLVAWAMLG